MVRVHPARRRRPRGRRRRRSAPVLVPILGLGLVLGVRPSAAQVAVTVPPAWGWAALGVDVTTELRPFHVRGRTLDHVHRYLAVAGPVGDDGSRGEALTTYELSVRWSAVAELEQCRVGGARVRADIVIDLPVWVDEVDASDAEATAWEGQRAELMDHEGAHRDEALRAAYRLVRAVKAQASVDCPGLARRVRAVIEREKDGLIERQASIDAHPLSAVRR